MGAAGLLDSMDTHRQQADLPRDLAGSPVRLEEGTEPSEEQVRQMQAVADDGARFEVPQVGLDVPLGALSEVDGQIVPPGFQSAYRVRNRGVPVEEAENGTVFVVMHSLRGRGQAPGDYLADRETGSSRVAPGDTVRVEDRVYAVTSSRLIDKADLPAADEVWTAEPGRLVIVTCMQRPDGAASLQNLVIFASLAA
ncbi:class F sortase [Xylanimonas allomyrinae]|uniref:Class F sortase n=1 Tax=Xylanimonas allomyrinae TaxID=2509459 RepID=A0A4P6EM74_9MICO|nr:class F sortase [Xylanimonas allomyrinae]QAY63940.1 class F sortase [Xylanimonas allomyrinae]